MLKIVHITMAKTWRGGEQQLACLMENKNLNQVVIGLHNSAFEKYAAENNLQFYGIRNHLSFFSVLQFIKKLKPDIIHVDDSKAHTMVYCCQLIAKEKWKIVVHRRVLFSPSSSWFTHKKYNDDSVKKIICISEAVQQVMQKVITEKSKLTVIYSGVDITKFETKQDEKNKLNSTFYKAYQLPDHAQIIGVAAALENEKNIEEAIAIFKNVIEKNENACLVIAGNGSLFNTYKQLYENDKIRFIGFQKNMKAFYNSISTFLFTSNKEGLGTAVLEAMSAGVPVVCRNFETAKEMIENGKNGYIYNNKNEAAVIINRLLTDENKCSAISKNGIEMIQQKFDKEIMISKTEEIYYSIVNIQA